MNTKTQDVICQVWSTTNYSAVLLTTKKAGEIA